MVTWATIKGFVVLFCRYYMQIIGITAVYIDIELRKISKSQLRSIYAFCINVIQIALFPFVFKSTYEHSDVVNEHQLLKDTDVANLVMSVSAVLVTMVFHKQRDLQYEHLAHELFVLDACYFDKLHPNEVIDRHFSISLIAKFLTSLSQLIPIIYSNTQLTDKLDWQAVLLSIYYINLEYIIHAVTFLYFYSLEECCKRFHLLNFQLQHLLHRLEVLSESGQRIMLQQITRSAATDLNKMSHVHRKLTYAVATFDDGHSIPTVAVLLFFLNTNVFFGFFSALVAMGSILAEVNGIILVAYGVIYTLMLIDLYLIYWICDATACAHNHTAYILQQFTVLPYMDTQFERQCEFFSLKLAQHKLAINVGGFFKMNLQGFVALWGYTVRHILTLVQFECENRVRHH